MKKINQCKAGAILTYVNLGIGMVIPLFYTPIMLQMLGQAEYGLYGLSNSVCSYLSLLTLGLGSAIVRYLMKYKTAGDKQMFERTAGLFLIFYLIIAVISVLVGIGITFFTKDIFGHGLSLSEISRLDLLIILMAVNSGVALISGVYSSISTCFERYVFQRTIQLASTILLPILNLVALYAGLASVGMVLASIFLQLCALVINILYCAKVLNIHINIKNPPLNLIREIFKFSAFVFVGMIADLLYWATDKVMIGAMVGSVAVAIYNVGSTFNFMLQNMSSAISSVFSARVNTLVFANRPISDISELMIRVGRVQYLIVSLMLSGFIVFGQEFIGIWAGAEYKDAYEVALLTMMPLAIPLIQNIAFTAIVAQNKHRFRSVLYVVLAVLNAVSTYLLIPHWGIIGAALCTCVVFIIGHGLCMNWYYYKKIRLDIIGFWKNILNMSIVPTGMVIISMVMKAAGLLHHSLWGFLLDVLVYTIIFCILSWLITMNRYEKNLIFDTLCARLKKTN